MSQLLAIGSNAVTEVAMNGKQRALGLLLCLVLALSLGCSGDEKPAHGPQAKAFETAFSAFTGAPGCVTVSSCTAAMHLAYFDLGIGPEDFVVVFDTHGLCHFRSHLLMNDPAKRWHSG